MLLYCIPKVIQVGAQFQVRTRIDVAGMKVRGTPGFFLRLGWSMGNGNRVCRVLNPGTQIWRSWANMEVGTFWGRSSPLWGRTGLTHSLGQCPPWTDLSLLSLSTAPEL